MPEIARELGVDAIVEGSIQRGGGRTRVLVQLISANDAQLWSKAYDHEGADLLSIEAEVARAIAQEDRDMGIRPRYLIEVGCGEVLFAIAVEIPHRD